MKKSYDLSKLDLNHYTENVWHIRAVYEDMVKHGRIGKFSAANEDNYECGAYRSVYYENEAITDMAYEFTMGFDDENPDRDQFINRYGCDYDDAIIAFAEERLPRIFDGKTENIEQADANSYARKVAYFSVIADRAYKRLQEDHKLDDNRKPVVTFLQYKDTIAKHQTMPEEKYRLSRGKTIKNNLQKRTEVLFTCLDSGTDVILDSKYVEMFDRNAEYYMFNDCRTEKMVISVYENGFFRGIVMPILLF